MYKQLSYHGKDTKFCEKNRTKKLVYNQKNIKFVVRNSIHSVDKCMCEGYISPPDNQ